MKRFLYFFVLMMGIIFQLGGVAMAQDVNEFTLENGLRVYLVPDQSSSLVSIRTFVRAGSIDESPHLGSGLSHFLEHIVAGGSTSVRSEDDYKDLIANLGGAFNAYTTTDHTSYYLNTLPEHTETAISILNEWMFSCLIEDSAFQREQEVITREIEKNEANIGRRFYQLKSQNFYQFHPLRYPVIGYLDNFLQINRDQLYTYYKDRYVASNMVLVVGGRFDTDRILAHIKDTFGKAVRQAPPPAFVFEEPIPFSDRYMEAEGDTYVTYLSLRFATTDLFSPDLYPLDLLEYVLTEGEASILYKRIVEDKKLAYSIQASSYTPTVTTGYFGITAEIDLDKKDEVIREILDVLNDIKKGRLDAKRVERAKRQKLSEDIFSVNTIEDKVVRVGTGVVYGFTPHFYDRYVSNFKSVKSRDVVDVANRYIDESRMVVTVLKPRVTEKELLVNDDMDIPPINVPDKVTLQNGVTVLFLPDKSLPKVHVKTFMLGGLRTEHRQNNGIGNVMMSLMGKGSVRYSKDRIQEIVEGRGAFMGGSMGYNTFIYTLEALSDDLVELLPLYFHTLLSPVFEESEFDETRRKIYQSIIQRPEDWFRFGAYSTKKIFYGDHPYSLAILGELDSVKSLTIDSVKTHYDKMINPNEMIITVAGDFDRDRVLSEIEGHLGRLKAPSNVYDIRTPIKRVMHAGATSETIQIPQDVAAIFVAFDGVSYSDASENVRLDLLDTVLSGANYPGGRLHNELREGGYVYVVHASNFIGMEPGALMIYALTSPDKVSDVETVISTQIEDVKTTLISDEEFDQAVAQLKFYYQDRIAAIENRALISATDELYGRGHDYYATLLAQVDALTKEDVRDAATQYLRHPQTFVFKK